MFYCKCRLAYLGLDFGSCLDGFSKGDFEGKEDRSLLFEKLRVFRCDNGLHRCIAKRTILVIHCYRFFSSGSPDLFGQAEDWVGRDVIHCMPGLIQVEQNVFKNCNEYAEIDFQEQFGPALDIYRKDQIKVCFLGVCFLGTLHYLLASQLQNTVLLTAV